MTADFVTICDTIAADLQAQVSSLATATPHKYGPWNPEEGIADGNRHFAVWPTADGADAAEPLSMGEQHLNQIYLVQVWEAAGTEATRGVADETADAAFLQIQNDVRARVYANQHWANTEKVQYVDTALPELPGLNRWFRMRVLVRSIIQFT